MTHYVVGPFVDKKSILSKSKIWTKFTEELDNIPKIKQSDFTPYIVHILRVSYFVGISPGQISKDGVVEGKYIWKRAVRFRKAFCVLWHFFLLLNIFTDLKQTAEGGDGRIPNIIMALYRVAYIVYTTYIVILLAMFWTKMDSLVEILNESISVGLEADERSDRAPLDGRWNMPNKVKSIVVKWGIVVFTIILWGFMNNTTETGKFVWEQIFLDEKGLGGLLVQSGNFVYKLILNPFSPIPATQMTSMAVSTTLLNNEKSALEIYHPWWIYALGLLHTLIDLCSTWCWIFADVIIALWSIHFRKLLQVIIMQGFNASSTRFSLTTIKLFTRALYLIEKFNKVSRVFILVCVMSETLYICSQTAVLLTGESTSIALIIISGISFLPFITVLISSAGINYEANDFSYFFKENFVNEHPSTKNFLGATNAFRINSIDLKGSSKSVNTNYFYNEDKYLFADEIDRGLSIIYHDLSNNVIGLQGYFFTITYGFVGTVLSGIFTFTVVALQLVSSTEGK